MTRGDSYSVSPEQHSLRAETGAGAFQMAFFIDRKEQSESNIYASKPKIHTWDSPVPSSPAPNAGIRSMSHYSWFVCLFVFNVGCGGWTLVHSHIIELILTGNLPGWAISLVPRLWEKFKDILKSDTVLLCGKKNTFLSVWNIKKGKQYVNINTHIVFIYKFIEEREKMPKLYK